MSQNTWMYLLFSLFFWLLSSCSITTRNTEAEEIQKPVLIALPPEIEQKPPSWKESLQSAVADLGAKNWIVVTEKAFPIPEAEGVQVVHADAELPEALLEVFDSIESEGHIWPRIYNLREFKHLEEDYAPGVGKLRTQKEQVFAGRKMQEITARTANLIFLAAVKKYRVLIVKTESAYPYSSVYMELDSGYWNGVSEDALRAAMGE